MLLVGVIIVQREKGSMIWIFISIDLSIDYIAISAISYCILYVVKFMYSNTVYISPI